MENLRLFLDIPNLTIEDAKQINCLSRYLKDRKIRRIIGHERLRNIFTNEYLRKLSFAELIDASNIIQGSYLEEVFESDHNQSKPIITTEQQSCFICNSNLKYYSASPANLYDDKSGKHTHN